MSDWRCRICGVLGHNQSEFKKESLSDHGDDSSSESDMENDNKDENHVDDYKILQSKTTIIAEILRQWKEN